MRRLPKDTEFNARLRLLLLPIVLQNLMSAAVNSCDVVMLNYVGQSSISAVSLASNYANVLLMVYYGLGTGASLLCAQYYGKEDFNAIRIVQGISLRFGGLVSLAAGGCALLLPETMMRLFTDDAELVMIGGNYLRIMSITYLCWGVVEIYLSVLRSVGAVVECTILNCTAFALNIFLNAVFIFGLFGAPRLGAAGVAMATALSRIVELLGCFLVSARRKNVKLLPGDVLLHNAALQSDFIRLAMPAMGNDVIWGVAFSMYAVILGHLGNDAVAANSMVSVVRNLSMTVCYAIASAAAVLLGNVLGEGAIEKARDYASRLLRLTVEAGIAGGVLILLISPLVLRFAAESLTETARHYLMWMLVINSYYVMGGAVNTTLIAGVFRAGGDTKFGLVCDSIDMWLYAVPLGFAAAFLLKLPVLWVYFLLCTDEFVKWPWVFRHYFSGVWAKNITRGDISVHKD